ncbi:MAG: ABC transporter ATP-binding protein [Calditrichaeota bacterium]|nr:MAG: ABC transporter ATP-binding protein [Calditrichota bacterium]
MIQVKKLAFTYPGNSMQTLNNIEFHIKKGEIFGFLGPNGAGKSTTQKVLIGILKSYHGVVKVLGQEPRNSRSEYYEPIGVAFEFPNLYSKFTALENLNFFRKLYKDKTEEPATLLRMVGLENDGNTRVADFSKGMIMRLNFCRSLINKPDILFLDEPTSGLDPVNLRRISGIIQDLKAAGKTICITTHDMHVADTLCDRVAFIVDGRIELIDSPRELKLQNGTRQLKLEYRENGHIVQREFSLENLGNNTEFITILKSKNVETVHTQEATLEDIFIKTTGRRLL